MFVPIRNLFPPSLAIHLAGVLSWCKAKSEANRAVAYLRTQKIVGIDTETRPSFRRGQQHKVALIQIATSDICFLFRLNYMGFPESLVNLLEDAQIAKVGLSLKDDTHQLTQRHPGFTPQAFHRLATDGFANGY